MPTFCRHNRFIERCPICSKTLPDYGGGARGGKRSPGAGGAPRGAKDAASRPVTRRARASGMRVYVEGRRRSVDDGYACELTPGLRSSEDARRLLDEIAFGCGRLRAMAEEPPGAYALAASLGRQGEIERASWLSFLIAYLSPLQGEEPFAAIAGAPALEEAESASDVSIEALALGPRTCHERGRGAATLRAFLVWGRRAGSLREGLTGESSWSPERRFERVFERMAIQGFPRWGRYELLVILGRLGLYELRVDSLHLAGATAPRGAAARTAADPAAAVAIGDAGDPVLAAAKRIFGIGDVLLLERRAQRLAAELGAPLEALELAFFNWLAPSRATLGFPAALTDAQVLERGARALGL